MLVAAFISAGVLAQLGWEVPPRPTFACCGGDARVDQRSAAWYSRPSVGSSPVAQERSSAHGPARWSPTRARVVIDDAELGAL
jgi:hypothetical protein